MPTILISFDLRRETVRWRGLSMPWNKGTWQVAFFTWKNEMWGLLRTMMSKGYGQTSIKKEMAKHTWQVQASVKYKCHCICWKLMHKWATGLQFLFLMCHHGKPSSHGLAWGLRFFILGNGVFVPDIPKAMDPKRTKNMWRLRYFFRWLAESKEVVFLPPFLHFICANLNCFSNIYRI